MRLTDFESRRVDELAPATLASYKKKAGAAATAADAAGDVKTADKRFSGIVKATKKQFDQDAKGVSEGSSDTVYSGAEDLSIGDPVIITGKGIEFEGTTGEIIDFGDMKRFVVVNLYNHGPHSFHSSDVSFNEYAGSDEEEARMYDTDPDARAHGVNEQGVAEGQENFNGIDISMEIQKDDEYVDDEDYDNQVIYVTASSNGKELGHVLFAFDGEYLMPQDLEVEERYRGQGIAQIMYDYVKSKGYKIRRSGQQTDAGTGFWDKHKPGKNVWEQGVAEGKADYNFDIEDLKRLERIRDLPTLKTQAMMLIGKPSAKPMRPEKVEWFKNALERMTSPMAVIKLMYDLLLSGEGHAVVGSKSSMTPNHYRQRFNEQGVTEAAQGHTIEAHGVRGMDRRTWHKTFKNTDQMIAWAEKHDAEIVGTRDLEQARHHNLSPAQQGVAEDSLAAMRRLAGIVPQVPLIVPNGQRQYRHMPTAVQPR